VSGDIIVLNDVYYSYPRSNVNVLNGINLSVKKGEFLAVMGSNGAGKTTFCKLLNGIIPHFTHGILKGTVLIDNINTIESAVSQLALKIGMVLDDPDAQLFTSSVFNEAAFGPENILLPPMEIKERVDLALSAVGLSNFKERLPSTLSGGEKQRLSIAAAITMKGQALVLDEPLCRLDPAGACDVMAILNDLQKKHQITIVMASHDSEKMAEFADRVCILNNGKIAALDSAKNIFANSALLEENGIQPVKKIVVRGMQRHPISKNSTTEYTEFHGEHKIFLQKPPCHSVSSVVSNSSLTINNLSYTYPNGTGIKNINFSVMENDFLAIVGDNGCGKTTLLKNITGLLRPCEGDIFIRGKNTKDLKVSDISKEVGFVMQNPDTQLFTDSVFKEVSFALKNMRFSKTEIKKRAEEALNTVGLYDHEAFPHVLCRSDRTKIVIACILAMGCKIIVFDEADVGNDYSGCLKIMNIAKDLHSKGYTIIFVTHNTFLTEEYAHRLIKMERNGIVCDWRPK